jgi:hypothetical protein
MDNRPIMKKGNLVAFRLNDKELAIVRAAAKGLGTSPGLYARMCAITCAAFKTGIPEPAKRR